jgi:DNA-directed RNA polymerase subunit RPC12/RpoP
MSKQFEAFRASELYCPRCGRLMPVRERLLLIVPGAEIHEYRCTTCGSSLGTREVRERPAGVVSAAGRGKA